jgi:hypothetical protein
MTMEIFLYNYSTKKFIVKQRTLNLWARQPVLGATYRLSTSWKELNMA